MQTFRTEKYASQALDYGFDWGVNGEPPWLFAGEAIVASTWAIDPNTDDGSLTLYSGAFTDIGTVVWASGGTPGILYTFYNDVTASSGRTGRRVINLYIVPVY